MVTNLQELLVEDEGLKLHPYTDTVGKLTLGVGRNLIDKGLSKEEALYLLNNDIDECRAQCADEFDWFITLNIARKDAILSMVFNMGINRVKGFKNFLAFMAKEDYKSASSEMLNSKWAKQVGRRAIRLSQMILNGSYPQ